MSDFKEWLKEHYNKDHIRMAFDLECKNKVLKQSRNKLLKALKKAFDILHIFDYDSNDYLYIEDTIERAQTLKEKETK